MLDQQAQAKSDTQAAEEMQAAKCKLFDSFQGRSQAGRLPLVGNGGNAILRTKTRTSLEGNSWRAPKRKTTSRISRSRSVTGPDRAASGRTNFENFCVAMESPSLVQMFSPSARADPARRGTTRRRLRNTHCRSRPSGHSRAGLHAPVFRRSGRCRLVDRTRRAAADVSVSRLIRPVGVEK